MAELGPRASAATPLEAATSGDIVVVAVPLWAYDEVPAEALGNKVVIDANNYYPERDGVFPELEAETTTTAELLQAHLPAAHVVKALNQIRAAEITSDALPAGSEDGRALAVAGDDAEAKATVARFLDDIGFDTVDAGPLAEGWRYQRDTPAYIARQNAHELRASLAAAKRYADQ